MTNIKRKLSIILIVLSMAAVLGSCSTGARELNKLAIAVATGFDIENDQIIVTHEVVNPAEGTSKNASTQEKTLFVQGFGRTIEEAVLNTSLSFDRQMYFPHNYLIIYGEEFAKRGIGSSLDILSRSNQQREQSYMCVAKGSRAYEIMGINNGMANSPGKYIRDVMEHDIRTAKTRTLTIYEFFRYFYIPTEEYVLGVAESIKKKQVNKNSPSTEISVISVEGGAVFNKDKLIGYFTGDEMIGFNFLVNELESSLIVFETTIFLKDSSKIITATEKFSSVQIFRSKTKLDVVPKDGKLHLIVDVDFRGVLQELNEGIDISKPGVLNEMERSCANKVKEYIAKTLEKAQKEYGVDTFGISLVVHRKYPELYRQIKDNWPAIFKDLEYTINVNAKINDTGLTNTPPSIMKGNSDGK